MRVLTEQQADAVYAILVEECGEVDYSDSRERDSFVRYMTSGKSGLEFRFQGALGFGGKCRLNDNRPIPYVDCYPEDETPARRASIKRANSRIVELFEGART